ncbi:putative ferredoxin/ferredoxin--NADP reductase [Marmoricola endophyticus]|uniref:ferredoxin--NADP(+) reductase n=1 Tax=Marmoricola endophyticus TaxID=2040280 RepID=A0A917BE65_9ACTN|nr:FAD-dependent oxidoreductase [Marmoricola endophyticus]GGF36276.1 putative ferredoxin/ferredoxin--NADP reductase [Marmoricola endophyticus]
MPYVVTQSCCADASCVVACPVNCIHPAPGEPGFATAEMVYVDAASCVDCGACATACPVDAVVPHTKLTPEQEPFRALAAEYYDAFPHRPRTPLAVVPAQRTLRRPRPARFAVVGAGPAGMYVADELLKQPGFSVDVLDRLPTPYGLLRAGVAPDHPHTKAAQKLFAAVEREQGFGYLLGVEVGRDVTLAELARHYDGVVYAVGAASDRRLGIEGEDLPGSLPATELVAWYNGHPDHQDLDVDLGHERAVVIGNGNVALDVARVLCQPPQRLEATDVSRTAYDVLSRSTLREVVVLGRRGPAEAAFTVPELVGLVGLAREGGIRLRLDLGGAELGDDPRSRLLAELETITSAAPDARTLTLRFLASPSRLLGDDRVAGVEVARTRLVETDGVVRAEPTGETETIEAGLVLRAVGYHGRPVTDLPYDEATGTVPSDRGRVRPGTYVAGWVKRGPTGFIGSNKADAQETVARILDDLDVDAVAPAPEPRESLRELLDERGVRVVDRAGWRAIEAEERRRGSDAGRERTKLLDVEEMLATAAASASAGPAARRRGYAARRARAGSR